MSELKLVSPLLDNLELMQSLQSSGGFSVYMLRHPSTGQLYIAKHIAVPESQTQVEALFFTGAATDEEQAQHYYEQLVGDYLDELEAMRLLHGSSNVASYLDWQVVPREGEVGFDLYLLSEKWQTLPEYLSHTAMTHLRALNLGLDLCTALCDLRAHRLIHRNIKPTNVYLNGLSSFMLGDLGVARLENLKYCAMPDRMITEYTAPELTDLLTPPSETIDIYSVGMVLYRILNGNHGPFEDEKTSSKAANKLRLSGTALPAPLYADYELTEILWRACAYEPADRYQSPEELMQELVRYMKRNRVSDSLIVPPIISDPDEVVSPDTMDEEVEPVRFADVESMDSDFVSSFTPDTAGLPPLPQEPVAEPTGGRLPPFAAPPTGLSPSDEEDSPAPSAAPQEKAPSRRKKLLLPGLIAVALAVVIGISVYFLAFGGPPIQVDAIHVDAKSTDFLTISLEGVGAGQATLHCVDTYGNAQSLPWEGEPLTFQDLSAGTQYTLTVLTGSKRKVTGAVSAMATTTPVTEVVSLNATSVAAGQVDLSLYVSGPVPEQWTIHYAAAGVPQQTATFTGNTATITGLQSNLPYTFELVAPEGYVLAGQTKVEFASGPEVVIEDLVVAALTKNSVKVTWAAGETPPEQWSVTCVGTDGTTKTQTVQSPEAEFTELSTGETYTITVTSAGTETPATVTASPIAATLDSFAATAGGADTIEVAWASDTEAATWQLLYALKNSPVSGKVTVTGTEITLTGLVPGATYELELQSGAGEKLSGTATAEINLPTAGRFGDYGANRFFMGLFLKPDKTNWSGRDLATGTTEFTTSQRIAYAVEPLSGRSASDDEVRVTLVVRDGRDLPVQHQTSTATWNELWVDNLCTGALEQTPAAGSYKLELFFNGQLAVTKEFTVS